MNHCVPERLWEQTPGKPKQRTELLQIYQQWWAGRRLPPCSVTGNRIHLLGLISPTTEQKMTIIQNSIDNINIILLIKKRKTYTAIFLQCYTDNKPATCHPIRFYSIQKTQMQWQHVHVLFSLSTFSICFWQNKPVRNGESNCNKCTLLYFTLLYCADMKQRFIFRNT